MMYLSGKYVPNPAIGSLFTYNGFLRKQLDDVWAADNGCFCQADKYSNEGYLAWLSKRDPTDCLFAVAPDVVGDSEATKERAYPMIPKIQELGYRAAFVLQDGETVDGIDWDLIDAVFVGGSTEWKLSQHAAEIVRHAKSLGKWAHMGRVNSYKRMRLAAAIGCDSVDGTFLVFGPDVNEKRLIDWLTRMRQEPLLDFLPSEADK